MNNDYLIYELIDRYLNHELVGEELESFKKKLSIDTDFAEMVDAQKIANQLIVDEQLVSLKAKMKMDMSVLGNSGFYITSWIKYLIITAVVGSSVFLIFNYYSKQAQDNNILSLNRTTIVVQDPTGVDVSLKDKEIIRSEIVDLINVVPEKEIKNNKAKEEINDKVNVGPVIDKGTHDITQYVFDEQDSSSIDNNNPLFHTSDEKENVLCHGVKISGKVSADPTCNKDTSGSITIDIHSIHGGTAPYSFSLGPKSYGNKSYFGYLSQGVYNIKVRDHNGCISSLDPVVVPEVKCKGNIDQSFSPGHGEVWKFPIQQNVNGEIKIFDRDGRIIFSTRLVNGNPSDWNGKEESGNQVEPDNYFFTINYDNGHHEQGNIKVVK